MESQRVIETKKKIKRAFLELCRTKRVEQIGIKEITQRAGVNRGTFYVYYMDIYDLQEKVEDESIQEIRENMLPVISALVVARKLNVELLPKAFLDENSDMLELFFGETAETRAVGKLKGVMQHTVMEMLSLSKKTSGAEWVKVGYVMEYIAAAQIAIIGHWLRNNMELPLEDLAELMEQINLNGAVTYLDRMTQSTDI